MHTLTTEPTKAKNLIFNLICLPFPKLKMFLEPFSESHFHGDVKIGLKIECSCRNDRESKCWDRSIICDEEEKMKKQHGRDKLGYKLRYKNLCLWFVFCLIFVFVCLFVCLLVLAFHLSHLWILPERFPESFIKIILDWTKIKNCLSWKCRSSSAFIWQILSI